MSESKNYVIPASENETVLIVPGFRVVQEESGFVGRDDEILELIVERDEDGKGRFVVDPVAQDVTLQVHELNDKEYCFFDLNKTKEGFEVILSTETFDDSNADNELNCPFLNQGKRCDVFDNTCTVARGRQCAVYVQLKKRNDRIAELKRSFTSLLLVTIGMRDRKSLRDIIKVTEITEEPEGVRHD